MVFRKAVLVCACAAASGCAPLIAQVTGQGTNWPDDVLREAKKTVSLLDAPSTSFRLEYDVQFPGKMPLQGHVRLREETRDRWWMRVSLGDFAQVKVKEGEMTYTQRNLSFEPKQVRDLDGLLHLEKWPGDLKVKKERRRVEDGHEMRCMEAEDSQHGNPIHEICVDAKTLDVLRVTELPSPMLPSTWRQYEDFVEAAGHRYPRKMEEFRDGKLVLSAVATEIKEEPVDPQVLTPPKGAIERRECEGMEPPVQISKPDLGSWHAATKGLRGDHRVGLWFTVLADGTVGDVYVTQSGGKQLDDALIAAVKGWKFKPAKCGNEPVVMDGAFGIDLKSDY